MHERRLFERVVPFLVLITLTSCGVVAPKPTTPPGETPHPGVGSHTPAMPYPQPSEGSPNDVVTSPPYPEPGEPGVQPWEPAPGDGRLMRGDVFIDEAQILTLESYPPQFRLALSGTLPTPCHQLRAIIPEPDSQDRIFVEVYSVADPAEICIQVLEPFQVSLPLQRPPEGAVYMVYVNMQEAGEIGF